LAIVLVAVTTAGAGPASAPPPPPTEGLDISYADGRVTADVRHVPLDEVIALLGERAGVEFYGELRDRREVSAHFDGARFRDVVDHLVGDQNFTITYDTSGRPARVELWGMPGASTSARVSPPASVQAGLANAVAQHPPVTLPPRLAAAFRTPTAKLPWLLRRGLRDGDAGVRAAAVAVFVRALNDTPRLRAAVQRTNDQALRQLIRSWAGAGEAQVLESLASQATDPLVRSKARRVLEQLKPPQARTRAPVT